MEGKKYRLKSNGWVFELNCSGMYYYPVDGTDYGSDDAEDWGFTVGMLPILVAAGVFEEVEEAEFTRSDVIEFAEYYLYQMEEPRDYRGIGVIFDDWRNTQEVEPVEQSFTRMDMVYFGEYVSGRDDLKVVLDEWLCDGSRPNSFFGSFEPGEYFVEFAAYVLERREAGLSSLSLEVHYHNWVQGRKNGLDGSGC